MTESITSEFSCGPFVFRYYCTLAHSNTKLREGSGSQATPAQFFFTGARAPARAPLEAMRYE